MSWENEIDTDDDRQGGQITLTDKVILSLLTMAVVSFWFCVVFAVFEEVFS